MLNTPKIPKQLRQTIERELQAGESVRWIEQPIPRFFTAASIGSLFFGIPFTGFALFWMWGASGFQWPDPRAGLQPQHVFALFGVPFALAGFGLLTSPIWTRLAARKTVYLVTDHRAIAIQGGIASYTIRSFQPDQLNDVYRRERSDGTGDVIIAVRRWKDSDGDQRKEELGFLGLRHPRDAEKWLKQLADFHS